MRKYLLFGLVVIILLTMLVTSCVPQDGADTSYWHHLFVDRGTGTYQELIPGSGNGTSGNITLPINESDVTNLVADLASKLSVESDPIFVASEAHSITSTNISNWSTAYSWGNHALAGYELQSNKGIANGYAGLDAGIKVATANLGSGTASNSTYLRGDQTWQQIPSSGLLTFLLIDTASSIGGSYKQMVSVSSYTPAIEASILTNNAVTGDTLGTFATNSGLPNVSLLADGVFHVHIHAKKSLIGTGRVYAQLYSRDVSGNETLIITTESSNLLTISEADYDIHSILNDVTMLSTTDRLVVYFKADIVSGTPDITIYYDGIGITQTSSRIEVPIPSPTAGSATWGSINGILANQTDLQIALDGKLSSVNGTTLDNVFSSTGLLKRTGAGTYSTTSDNSTSWDTAYNYRLISASGTSPLTLTLSNNALTGSIDTTSFLTTSWTGNTTISKVGTITIGTWNGTAIADGYIASAVTWNGKLSSVNGTNLDNVWSSNGLLKRTGASTYATAIAGGDYAPAIGSSNITTLGAIGTGTWSASIIPGQYGGTGVANTNKLITVGGNTTLTGAFNFNGTLTAATVLTFPVNGTLLSDNSTATLTNKTWNSALITGTYGGTGVNNGANTITIGSNFNEIAELRLSSTISTSAIAGITTGLAFNFVASSFYTFDIYASVNSSATSTGFGMDMVATGSKAGTGTNVYGLTITHPSNTAQALTSGYSTANATIGGMTSGVPVITTKYNMIGRGYFYSGVGSIGTITFFFASEVAGSFVSLNPGTIIIVRKVS